MPSGIASVSGMPSPAPRPMDDDLRTSGTTCEVKEVKDAPTSTITVPEGHSSRLGPGLRPDEARSMLDKIDVLMASAAKESTVAVDAAELRGVASSLLAAASKKGQ